MINNLAFVSLGTTDEVADHSPTLDTPQAEVLDYVQGNFPNIVFDDMMTPTTGLPLHCH